MRRDTSLAPSAPPPRKRDTLGDGTAIMDLIARFDDAVNRRDVPEFTSLWAQDAVWEIGDPLPMRADGRDKIVATWTQMLGATEWLFRGSFMGLVDVTGDSATGRWPCIETGAFKPHDGVPARGYDNRALYEDRYVKQDGKWYFAQRRYLYLWLSNERLPGSAVALGQEIDSGH